MNKTSSQSYLHTLMTTGSIQNEYGADTCLSQHDLTLQYMCFDFMMCHMMMKA
ncbi:hypothetical protein [Chryseobacterium paridis]|uniref:Uncharacterized protein n=1 Tax=Chryseobacterium paridis TaxID=2800328 RepID=A0ABS1FW56_9FLAO|nr:hypothetical protein [Chryseobacterium paridis]MBK1896664.1 hypothetical protein [Chryseobacterium paridis]